MLLSLAFFADPHVVGIYNWGILVFTLFQAVTDAPIRQVIIVAISSRRGLRFLSRYRVLVPVFGFVSILSCCLVLNLTLPRESAGQAWTLLPIAFAPLFTAAGVESVGRLQRAHKWRILATGQLVAATASLAIAVPVLVLFRSPLGCSLGLLATEVGFALWCRVQARRSFTELPLQRSGRIRPLFQGMAAYSGLAWTQGQADRVLIGAFSGPSNLGIFSMAIALARSLGDAMAASNANVLRSELSDLTVDQVNQTRERATRVLNRGVLLATCGAVLSVALTQILVAPLLGPEWAPSTEVVPILALCTVPSMLSWSSAVLHVARRTSTRALVAPIVGILFAVPIALLAITDLPAAAWAVLAREVTLTSIGYGLIGRAAPWKSYLFGMVLVAVGSIYLLAII
ncbi:lipopolysaccharide biosynthesis protein [Arthrobacter sp. 4R501]|uniref:lipopolysaccharide biosynthesis protein n=1 Tax=Arthrobacter sp. 4R501 TaxID=2058886 RepID=UPI0034D6104A